EQLGGNAGAALRNLIKRRSRPVETLVNGSRFVTRKLAHRAGISIRPRDSLSDPETGWATLVGRIGDIPAFAVDHRLHQAVDVNRVGHTSSPRFESQS